MGEAGGSKSGCFAAATDGSTANQSVSSRVPLFFFLLPFFLLRPSNDPPLPNSSAANRPTTPANEFVQAPPPHHLSTPHKSHFSSLLFSSLLFSISNLQAPQFTKLPAFCFCPSSAPQFIPTPCFFVFCPSSCSPVYAHSLPDFFLHPPPLLPSLSKLSLSLSLSVSV